MYGYHCWRQSIYDYTSWTCNMPLIAWNIRALRANDIEFLAPILCEHILDLHTGVVVETEVRAVMGYMQGESDAADSCWRRLGSLWALPRCWPVARNCGPMPTCLSSSISAARSLRGRRRKAGGGQGYRAAGEGLASGASNDEGLLPKQLDVHACNS